MSQPSPDLVDTITRVLTNNPQLLSRLAPSAGPAFSGGAPGNVCTTCNPCKGSCATQAPSVIRHILGGNVRDARITASLGAQPPADLAAIIDHTLLKGDATYDMIDRLCDEAKNCGFASVCVNPMHVRRCADRLRGSTVKVCTVVGFPLGSTQKETKALEARRAIRDGAREIDMVISVGALKSGDNKYVYDDIAMVTDVCRESGVVCKVIIETCLLTDEEKVTACVLAKQARAHFVKTSTGMSTGGATEHDVALMARAVDYKLEVKASGGVRSTDDAIKMVSAGASRIGASVGMKIAGCNLPGESVAAGSY